MQMKGCPRQRLCAFYHRRSEHRKTSPDDHDYDHPLPIEVIDAAWAEQFLNPPIFDNLDDEAGGYSAVAPNVSLKPQADALDEVLRTIEKVTKSDGKLWKVPEPQKVTVNAAFAWSKDCLLPGDAKASQRQLSQGADDSLWNMVNNAVTELL